MVTNYGEGGYKTGGGQVKFYPYEKGGVDFFLAMLKRAGGGGGGGRTSFGVVFPRMLEVLAILKG